MPGMPSAIAETMCEGKRSSATPQVSRPTMIPTANSDSI